MSRDAPAGLALTACRAVTRHLSMSPEGRAGPLRSTLYSCASDQICDSLCFSPRCSFFSLQSPSGQCTSPSYGGT